MKKITIIAAAALAGLLLQNCGSTKKAAGSSAVNSTTSYTKDIMPLMKTSCSPCHFPPGGRKEPLDSYDAVKKHIGEIIERIKLPQSDERFMPFRLKKPALGENEIALLLKWKEENMPD